ncbi:CapA family protein [Trichothermofontia sp.]
MAWRIDGGLTDRAVLTTGVDPIPPIVSDRVVLPQENRQMEPTDRNGSPTGKPLGRGHRLLAAAQRGQPQAIALLLNQAMPWPGVRGQVYWLGPLSAGAEVAYEQWVLVIDLSGDGLPNAEAIVAFIRRGLQRLAAPSLCHVCINAHVNAPVQGDAPISQWSQWLHLSSPVAAAPTATPETPLGSTARFWGMGVLPGSRPAAAQTGPLPHRRRLSFYAPLPSLGFRLPAGLALGTIGAIALLGYGWPLRFHGHNAQTAGQPMALLATRDLKVVEPLLLTQGSPPGSPKATPTFAPGGGDAGPMPTGADVWVPTRFDGTSPSPAISPTLPPDSPTAYPTLESPIAPIDATPAPTPLPVEPALSPSADPWQQAISHALQAADLNQRAQFRHEWETVANHWQQAIACLRRVPPDHSNYALAQQKIGEYSRNLAYASGNVNQAIAITLGHPDNAITVKAVGDMVPGVDFPSRRLPPHGGRHLFDAVRPALGAADLVLGNFESTLTTHPHAAKDVRRSNVYAFRTPPAFAAILRRAGFDRLSVANNHSMDFGLTGFQDTIRHIEAAGMKAIGQKDQILYLERKGVTIALIGFSYLDVHNSVHNLEAAKRLVRQANEKATIVIISVHMGAEGTSALHVRNRQETFFGELRGNPVLFSRTMIDTGADLILGHGPHVPRAIEVYGNKLIAYSLGNFVGYGGLSSAAETGYSLILEVQMDRLGNFIAGQIIPIHIDGEGIPKLDRQFRTVKLVQRLNHSDFPQTPLTITPQGYLQRQS